MLRDHPEVGVERQGLRGGARRLLVAISRVLLMLVLVAAVAACGDAPEPPAPKIIYHIGQAIPVGPLVVTVNSVTHPPANEFQMPDSGKKFLGVNVTIKNKDTQPLMIFSRNIMFVRDSRGNQYTEDPTATMVAGTTPPDGDPYPDKEIHGTAGYQIPDNATGLTLVVDTTQMTYKFLVGGPQGDRAVVALQ